MGMDSEPCGAQQEKDRIHDEPMPGADLEPAGAEHQLLQNYAEPFVGMDLDCVRTDMCSMCNCVCI